MTGARRPALVRPPSNEWFPASDDQDRAHLASCRRYITACSPVQQECRLNYRLVSKMLKLRSLLLGATVALAISLPGVARAELSCRDYLRAVQLQDEDILAQARAIAQP